jgi:diguanylate cyclase (GGDEF)-like protein/PAS domain S-box-containing protein
MESRENERHFAELFGFVELASVMLDRGGNITYCNNFLLDLTGWTLPELIGRNWFETFVPAQRGENRPDFAQLLEQSPDTWRRENVIATRSGELRRMRWHSALRRSADGEIIGSASIGEDVTERQAATEALEQRASELERFHRLSVGRELRMIELKKQLNETAALAGEAAPFALPDAAAVPGSEPAARRDGAPTHTASFWGDEGSAEPRVSPRGSVRRKISTAFVILAVLVALFVGSMIVLHVRTIEEASQVQAEQVAALMADYATDARGFRPDLREFVAREELFRGREFAIVDARQVAIAAADPGRVGRALPREELRRTLRDGGHRRFVEGSGAARSRYVVIPVLLGEAVIGAVAFEYSPLRAALFEADQDEFYVIAIGGALFVFLVVWFGLSAARRLSRPLGQLMSGVSRIAAQDFSARVPVTSDDEFGQLEAAFNRMAALIGSSHAGLSDFNARLDREVHARTRELRDASMASLNMMDDAIREREIAEKAVADLDYLSSYDSLTGLANRQLFLRQVGAEIEAASARREGLAVSLLDVERFKNFNDSQGQVAGDALLRQLAHWLPGNVAEGTRIARVGADQFAILWSGPDVAAEFAAAMERLALALLEQPFPIAGAVFRIAARLGVAVFPADGSDAQSLFNHAEAALKAAKTGAERVAFYEPAMSERVAGKPTMESRLRHALEREEFVLHYQPKVNLGGQLTGAEALIRWQDPEAGLVPPGSFIPLLEETGLISDVGQWAMRRALADFLRWSDAGFVVPRIAVNVSPLQLRSKAFIAQIEAALAVDERAVEGLELEITESMIMENVRQGIATLQSIRALGVTIALDDFGTGFSSLGYLSKLPIDTLKVDRSFIVNMTTGPEGMSLVSLVINLARSLRLKVVAEGIETEEQARILRLLRCDELQGYLFGRPVDAPAFEKAYLAPQFLR